MGNCCQLKSAYQIDFLEYRQKIKLRIVQRDKKGNFRGYFPLSFELSSPIDQLYSIFNINKSKYRVSGCVIAGIDPHGKYSKECQDSYSVSSKNNVFFAVLLDGHGREGRKVSLFCRDFMINYFNTN